VKANVLTKYISTKISKTLKNVEKYIVLKYLSSIKACKTKIEYHDCGAPDGLDISLHQWG
jgi:hypothetical protein